MITGFKNLSKEGIAKRLAISLVLMSALAAPVYAAAESVAEPVQESSDTAVEGNHQSVKKKIAIKKNEKKAQKKTKKAATEETTNQHAVYAPASTATTQKLEHVLAAAYDYNSEIKAARSAVRAADEAIAKAKSGYRPTVNLSGSVGPSTTINSGSAKNTGSVPSSSKANNIAGGIQATQNIFQGWNTEASVAEAESDRQSTLLELVTLEQRVFSDTVTAYLSLLSLAAETRLLKASVAVFQETLNASQVKFNVGEETRTSVAQAQAQLASYNAQLSSKEAELEAQKATFTRLTGLIPGDLSKPNEFIALPGILAEAVEIAMVENPEIQSKKHLAEAADHAKTRVSSGLYPRIDLQAGSDYTNTDTKNRDVVNQGNGSAAPFALRTRNNTVNNQISLKASIPLYEGGAIRADRRAAHETSEKRRIEIETTRRRIEEQLIQLWTSFKAAKNNLEFYRQQVIANEISLEGTQQEMSVGTKILLDVLNERSKLIQAQQNLVSAEKDYYISGYKLMATMGRLTSAHLNLPVQIYDADTHYQETVDRW